MHNLYRQFSPLSNYLYTDTHTQTHGNGGQDMDLQNLFIIILFFQFL